MNVTISDKARIDPRMRRVAMDLGITRHQVMGCLVDIWALCLTSEYAFLSTEDIDATAELAGFAGAMLRHGLAELDPEVTTKLRIKGVDDTLRAKERSREGGRLSGETRRKMRDELQKRSTLEGGLKGTSRVLEVARDRARARKISDLTSYEDLPEGSYIKPSAVTYHTQHAQSSGSGATALQINDTGEGAPPAFRTPTSQARGQNVASRVQREPSLEAQRLASLLMTSIVSNHPGGQLAVSSRPVVERTIVRWSDSFDAMHRLDRRTWEDIAVMITWSQNSEFWRAVVLGPDLLRKHWPTMVAQRERDNSGRKGPGSAAKRELEQLQGKEAG